MRRCAALGAALLAVFTGRPASAQDAPLPSSTLAVRDATGGWREFWRSEAAPIVWVHELLFPTILNKRYKDVIVSPLGIYGSYHRAWLDR